LQIDGDVDLEVSQQPRHLKVARRANIVKLIERLEQTGAHLAAVRLAEGNSRDFEPRPVVELKQLRHQVCRRMSVEIRRQIREAYPVMAPHCSTAQRRR